MGEFAIDQRVTAKHAGERVQGTIKSLRARDVETSHTDAKGVVTISVVAEPIARVRTDDGSLLVIPLAALSAVEDAPALTEGQGANEGSDD